MKNQVARNGRTAARATCIPAGGPTRRLCPKCIILSCHSRGAGYIYVWKKDDKGQVGDGAERRQSIGPEETIRVDLHLHSWCSDGFLSPRDVLDKVKEAGIEVASITDHETASGYNQVKENVPAGMKLIPGIEFSTICKTGGPPEVEPAGKSGVTREIHILGYFPAGISENVDAFLEERKLERVNRAKVALFNLRKKGCHVAYEQVMEHVRGDCVSRAHMARALVAAGWASSANEAFNRYLNLSRGIVPAPLLSTEHAIKFIAGEGGIPVWAHPELEAFDLLVKEFADCGLRGVEICAQKRAQPHSLYFEQTARVLGLLATYGSDWHGLDSEPLGGITVQREKIAGFVSLFE